MSLVRLFMGGCLWVGCVGQSKAEEASTPPPVGYRAIFDGKSLEGWEGNQEVWSVENGMIVGQTPGRKNNEFLATTRRYRDFYLRASFRLVDGAGNSGIQFRSERIPSHHEMIGYQADVGQQYWGCLYDESRRKKILVQAPPQLEKVLKKDGWNEYAIRCMGNRIEMFLNGMRTVNYVEEDPQIAQDGLIALQVHSAPHPIRVEFKDIFLQEFPTAVPATGSDTPVVAETEKGEVLLDSTKTGFLLQTIKGADGKESKYSLFLPSDYYKDDAKRWPTILFLHGAGERGSDGQLSIKVGIGPAILSRQKDFPFIVVCPQAEESWAADSPDGQRAIAILDEVVGKYRVDPDRVYLTGLSMGGMGTWSIAGMYPQRWAALAMICGRGDVEIAKRVKHLPFWGFCGDKDNPALLDGMRDIVAALKTAGTEPKYTEYPGVGHNCWDNAYNTDELYAWLLRQRRTTR